MITSGDEIRLIVNADDFGMSRGITDAIIAAHRYGFLTSASVMVNMPTASYAIERAHVLPWLGLGIHLNICQGQPVLRASAVPTLVGPDGIFHAPQEMARRLWFGRVSQIEIEGELRAQIQRLKDLGVTPSHADSHHHMHIYPFAARAFARALEAERIRCARACRCSAWPTNGAGGPHEGNLLRRILVQSYRRTLQSTVFRQFYSPNSRISFHSRDRKDLAGLRDRWKLALENLPPGTFELSCHPGLFERGFSEADRLRAQREQEMIWLLDRELQNVIAKRHIRLISYRELYADQIAGQEKAKAAA